MASLPDRNATTVRYRGLVVLVARRYLDRGLPLEDLVQLGQFGLMHAAETFDGGRGFQFSTYAVPWIRQAISRGLWETAWTIHLPGVAREELARYRAVRASIAERTGREPGRDDVLAAMVPASPKAGFVRRRLRDALAIDEARRDPAPLEDVRPDPSPSSFERASLAEQVEQLGLALRRLGDEHRAVLSLRYGLGGHGPMGPKSTARALRMSFRNARAIEADAISSLRRHLNVPDPDEAQAWRRRRSRSPSQSRRP